METYINQLLFGVFPYLAGSAFLLGSFLRYERGQYTWRAMSSQTLSNPPAFRWASIAFHLGILALFFGHLLGLLTPTAVYTSFGLTPAVKQVLALVAGGFFGIVCFFGLTYLLFRRLFNARVRANSSAMDTFIICLIYLQLCTGLYTLSESINHMEGALIVDLGHWAQGIVTFQGGAWRHVEHVSWIYKTHILLGLIMFTAFPFSRLVHVWSWPVEYVARRYQIVRPQ